MPRARIIRPAKIPQKTKASGYQSQYLGTLTDKAAIDFSPELNPLGPIEQVPDETMADIGLTSVYQSEPQKIVSMQMPMHVHKRAGKFMDGILGKAAAIKVGGYNTGLNQRPGEGKWLRNLIDKHNRKLKKDFRKVEFDKSNIYIYSLEHPDLIDRESGECLVTMHTIGRGVNSIKIMLEAELADTLTQEMAALQNMIDQKRITVNKIEVMRSYKMPYN
jgi:hypothetical protein